jgi:hypothetical protein
MGCCHDIQLSFYHTILLHNDDPSLPLLPTLSLGLLCIGAKAQGLLIHQFSIQQMLQIISDQVLHVRSRNLFQDEPGASHNED